MAHPYHHALSSQKKWGGKVEVYLPIHNWFDASKAFLADFRHRALRHHAEGIFWAEEVFGPTITNSAGKVVPVRFIAEQHVKEDLGWIPTLQDWFKNMRVQPWMAKAGDRQVARGELMATDNQGTLGTVVQLDCKGHLPRGEIAREVTPCPGAGPGQFLRVPGQPEQLFVYLAQSAL